MAEKLKYSITCDTQNLHISKHSGSFLMNPNLPKVLKFGIKIYVFLCRLTSLKLKQIFCNQNIKIKGGMQATAICHKWNNLMRMPNKSIIIVQL